MPLPSRLEQATAAAAVGTAALSTVLDSLRLPAAEDPVVRIPVAVGIVLRILLFFYTDASSFLQSRIEASTPLSSWKRLQEGLFLYQHGIPPYEGGVFHQAPLLLLVFNFLPPVLVPLLFTFIDYAIARSLVAIGQHKRALQIDEVWPASDADVALMASMPIAARAGRVDGPESNLPHEAELPIPRAETASEGSSWLHRRASTVGGEPTGAAITEATKGPCKGSSEGLADAEDDDQPPAPTSPFPPWLEGDDDKIVQGETVGPAIKILRPASDDPTQPVDVLLHPENVGALYLMNPYSILACLALSSLVFTILAIAKGIEFATKGNRNASMLALAVAAYLSLYPAMLVAPATLLLAQHSGRPVMQEAKASVSVFMASLASLLGLSYLLVGTWQFLPSTYGVILTVPDLTPNIGLYWYFFMEMFEQFRPLFLAVFQIMVFVFAIPLTMVFKNHPLFVVYTMTAIMAIFKSYPSVGDTALAFAFLAMHRELYKYMRHTFLVFTAIMFASVLGPLFYYLWVYAGSGNANFYFAITLVFGLAQVILLTDSGLALILREWERLNPDLRRKRVELVHQ